MKGINIIQLDLSKFPIQHEGKNKIPKFTQDPKIGEYKTLRASYDKETLVTTSLILSYHASCLLI
jgi:hypothetical protein